MKRSLIPVLLAAIVLVFYSLQPAQPIQTIPPVDISPSVATSSATIVRVIDGDTILVLQNGKKEYVRFIGVDTPETVDPRKPVQCFGKEASAFTKKLLSDQSVILESDPTQQDRDKYKRLLRYVYLPDGTLVNKKIIADGYGFEYTYRIPYKFRDEFKEAQSEARSLGRGLWAEGACSD